MQHGEVVLKRKGKMVVKHFLTDLGNIVIVVFLEKGLKKYQSLSFLSSLQTQVMSVALFTQFHLKTNRHAKKTPLKPQIACLVILGYTMS